MFERVKPEEFVNLKDKVNIMNSDLKGLSQDLKNNLGNVEELALGLASALNTIQVLSQRIDTLQSRLDSKFGKNG